MFIILFYPVCRQASIMVEPGSDISNVVCLQCKRQNGKVVEDIRQLIS